MEISDYVLMFIANRQHPSTIAITQNGIYITDTNLAAALIAAREELSRQWHVITKNEDCPDVSGDYEVFVYEIGSIQKLIIEKSSYDINEGWDTMNFVLAWRKTV